MRRFWRRGDDADLERRLAAERAEPRDAFLEGLVLLIEAAPAEQSVLLRRRVDAPRLALVGIATALMVVVLAAFGGVGYATSGMSHVVKSTGHSFMAVFSESKSERHGSVRGSNGQHGNDGHGSNGEHGNDGHDEHHDASHHTYPYPGFWCFFRDGKPRIKLVMDYDRYRRLLTRGYSSPAGPFPTRLAARHACSAAPSGHENDDL